MLAAACLTLIETTLLLELADTVSPLLIEHLSTMAQFVIWVDDGIVLMGNCAATKATILLAKRKNNKNHYIKKIQ